MDYCAVTPGDGPNVWDQFLAEWQHLGRWTWREFYISRDDRSRWYAGWHHQWLRWEGNCLLTSPMELSNTLMVTESVSTRHATSLGTGTTTAAGETAWDPDVVRVYGDALYPQRDLANVVSGYEAGLSASDWTERRVFGDGSVRFTSVLRRTRRSGTFSATDPMARSLILVACRLSIACRALGPGERRGFLVSGSLSLTRF